MASGGKKNSSWLWRPAFLGSAALLGLAVVGWLFLTRPDHAVGMAGNLSAAAAAPDKLMALLPLEKPSGAEADVPRFDVVRVTRSGTGVITGHAVAASVVEIFANGKFLDKAKADSKGDWAVFFTEPLKAGGVELGLQAGRPGENLASPKAKTVPSTSIAIVVVPPGIQDRFIEGDSDGVVAILSPRDHAGAAKILQRPGPATTGDVDDGLGFGVLDYGDAGGADLSGNAPAYADLQVYLDNRIVAVAAADQYGKWRLALKQPISVGKHLLRLDQVDGKGKVGARLEASFERLMPPDAHKMKGNIAVLFAADYWRIARKIPGDGFHYTLVFKVARDQVKDPDATYPEASPVTPPPAATPAG